MADSGQGDGSDPENFSQAQEGLESMADTFLSLDIDDHGISAMVVASVSKKPSIKETCHIQFKDLPGTDDPEELFDLALAYIENQLDITSCSTATLLIPSSAVSFRTIELPFKSARKIKQILPIEIASLLPSHEENYISDFHILNLDHTEGQVPVFTASVAAADIEKYILALHPYGIKPVIITPKGYAAAICLLNETPSLTNFICLDLGVHENTILLVYHQAPFLVRSVPAAQYTDEPVGDAVKQTLLGFWQTMGTDTCFDLFITAPNNFKSLEKIYTGLESLLAYQDRAKRSKRSKDDPLRTPTLKKINSPRLMSTLHPNQKTGPFINFYTVSTRSNPFFQKNFKALTTSIVLVCSLFVLYFYNLNMEFSDLNTKINDYENRIASIYKTNFPDEKDVKHPLLQMQSHVKTAIKESQAMKSRDPSFQKSNHKTAQLLAVLSEGIPGSIDMEITNFSLTQKRLVISGTTDNFKNVDQIKNFIEKIDIFKHVSIDTATADKKTDQVFFKFTIQMEKKPS